MTILNIQISTRGEEDIILQKVIISGGVIYSGGVFFSGQVQFFLGGGGSGGSFIVYV